MLIDSLEKKQLWEKALAEIELSVSRPNFLTWFQNTNISDCGRDIITLNVPNAFAKDWLSGKYHKIIIKALRALFPAIRNVEYVIVSQPPVSATTSIKYKPAMKISSGEPQLEFEEIYIDKGTAGLEEIPTIGKNLALKIEEYIKTGKIKEYGKKQNVPN